MKQDHTTGKGNNPNHYFYCLMTNGEMEHRPKGYNIQSLEDDPNIKIWWKINQSDKSDAYKMLVRAFVEGAKREDIFSMVNSWQLNDEACKILIQKYGLVYKKENRTWIVGPAQIDSISDGRAETLFEAACLFYDSAVHA